MIPSPYIRNTILMLGLGVLFSAPSAYAADIALVPESSAVVGDVVRVGVYLDNADGINAAEGSVSIPEGLDVSAVSTVGSAFTMWPVAPRYDIHNRTISYSGGVPGGIQGKRALLYTLDVRTTREGSFVIAVPAGVAYRNDGKGTSEPLAPHSLALEAGVASSSGALPQHASVIPDVVYADIGRDPALFGGKYFLAVGARDADARPGAIEVKEGWWRSYEPLEAFYVLKDQRLQTGITIRIMGDGGGVRVMHIAPQNKTNILVEISILGLIFLSLGIGYLWRRL